jgi:hypothetical protein
MMHAKLYLFSKAGSTKLVSMIGSSNIAASATTGSWNNLITMVNNNPMYTANLKYFNDMLKNKSWKNYFFTAQGGAIKEYYYPRKGPTTTMMGILDGVNCKARPAKGYGYQGRTYVRVAMYAWTNGRANIAKKLMSMRAAGCNVDILWSGERVEQPIINILLKKTKRGVMPVYNGRLKKDVNAVYMHHKVVTINGVYGNNRRSTSVYTGSANFTASTERECNEIMVRVNGSGIWHQFNNNINLIRTRYAKKVTKAKGAMHYTGDTKHRSSPTDDFMLMPD